jgi:hypothetical protein
MNFSDIFVPLTLIIKLPGAPDEFKTMHPRRISQGDLFDAEVQFTEGVDNPIYIGEIVICSYDTVLWPRQLLIEGNMSSDILYGDWVLTDLSVSPAADTTVETEGIIRPQYWKLNGISINLANQTKMKGAVPISIQREY